MRLFRPRGSLTNGLATCACDCDRTDRDPNWVGYLIGLTHAWFGKALVLLGLVEIYLGLALYCVPTYVMVRART